MSKTPAQQAGLVVGKTYKVSSNECRHYDGGTYIFTEDDGTRLPYFQLVKGSEGPQDERACIYIDGTGATTFEEVPQEPVAVHINLNGNSTTIVVQRNLNADEVAAVLKAINAA